VMVMVMVMVMMMVMVMVIVFTPALSPNTVTLSKSPPKCLMLRCVHCSAARWSCRPKLPNA
jgi:predicted nuclease of predicted toxin-antitoxin system